MSLLILKSVIHYSMHILAPGIIATRFFKSNWQQAWVLMLSTMLVDLDHLLANPIFDPNRCSIGFHPLHSHLAIQIYVAVFLLAIYFKLSKTKVLFLGLCLHMLTDFQDCFWF